MAAEELARGSERVLALMAQLSTASGPEIDRKTILSEIGFDSLAFAELASALEGELGIDLADAGVCRARTAGDLLDLIEGTTVTPPAAGRTVYPAGMGRMQRLAKAIGGPVFRWWFHLEVRGTELMPSEGPVILCMNHESMLDIPLIVIASR